MKSRGVVAMIRISRVVECGVGDDLSSGGVRRAMVRRKVKVLYLILSDV